MGISKTEHFSEQQNAIAALAKAFAHPARVAIIEYLLRVDACICGDIVEQLPLSQPTVSQHLKELKNAGFIVGTIEGNSICYCINKNTIDQLRGYFNAIAANIDLKNQSCCTPKNEA